MRLHILELDEVEPEAEARGQRFRDLFVAWLKPALPEARFTSSLIVAGEPLPAPGDHDAFILTGSRHGVYEDLPWMRDVIAFLRAAAAVGAPVAGICFGHQIMAAAHGGEVRKYPGGWNIGRMGHRVAPSARPLFGGRDSLHVLSFHQDQVMRPPQGAEVLLGSERSPCGGLRYRDFPQMSVQFHPEFRPETVRLILRDGADPDIPAQAQRAALASLEEGPLDNDVVAAAFARFFREALRRK
ncbi:type 1 glutamine amidotransferase [Camelimonas abortus]|uniref:Type 1 glutamine amidotransferase n=1 Tax=Camelimonas abortus TaxID=1017184 RepID=A0ABV7LBZ6_9HYPH